MEIRDFSELTNFLSTESLKMMDCFGLKKFDKIVKFSERELKRYMKLYSSPIYRRSKREIKLAEAIDTMPHGLWWKMFHIKLWKQIKRLEAEKKRLQELEAMKIKEEILQENPPAQVFTPVVITSAPAPVQLEPEM